MSSLFYPLDLPGLTWESTKSPNFSTSMPQGDGGREVRVAIYPVSAWQWKLAYSFVKQGRVGADSQAGLNELMAFYNAVRAGWDDFLFRDPNDNLVSSPQVFAISDGVTPLYQLSRQITGQSGTMTDIINAVPATPTPPVWISPIYPGDSSVTIYLNGTPTAFSGIANIGMNIVNDGQIGFGNLTVGNGAIPTAGTILSWSGNFYFRVKFATDVSEFAEFMLNYWQADMQLESARLI